MEKTFNINLPGDYELVRAYVEILRPFLKGVRDKELDILAYLLLENTKKVDIKDVEERFKLILHPSNRKKIIEALEVSDATFRNALTNLRKRGILKDNNVITQSMLLDKADKSITVHFNLYCKI